MKHSLLFSAVLAALVLGACEKSTVVPSPTVATPPGGTGLAGSIPAPLGTSPDRQDESMAMPKSGPANDRPTPMPNPLVK